jgi:hypothetical protein
MHKITPFVDRKDFLEKVVLGIKVGKNTHVEAHDHNQMAYCCGYPVKEGHSPLQYS